MCVYFSRFSYFIQRKEDKFDTFKCDTHIQIQKHTHKFTIIYESHRYYSNILKDRQLYIILIYQIDFILPCICIIFTGNICDLIITQDTHNTHTCNSRVYSYKCIWKTQWEFHFQFLDDGITLRNTVYIRSMKNNNHSHFENILLFLWFKLVTYIQMECAMEQFQLCVVLIKIRPLWNDLLAVGGPNWHRIFSPLNTCVYAYSCVLSYVRVCMYVCCCSLFPLRLFVY